MNALLWMPQLPMRFPNVITTAANPEVPGLQVCDFILWALQRAKDDWKTRLGLRTWSLGGKVEGAHQQIDCMLGRDPEPPVAARDGTGGRARATLVRSSAVIGRIRPFLGPGPRGVPGLGPGQALPSYPR
jgi:hypothetical protein